MTEKLVDAARIVVPELDAEPWPSLGGHVCRWIEEHLVHGPGDVRGHPAELTDEYRLFIWRCYEVHPPGAAFEGRRRFKRAGLSRRKGAAKTELLAWLALCELDPHAPVRHAGWHTVSDRRGSVAGLDPVDRACLEAGYQPGELVPLGRPVVDPYIPLVATTEAQSDDLAYAVCKVILETCELGSFYDIGEQRIRHRTDPGVLKSLASAPNSREGALTSFQGFDETHLFASDKLRKTHATMLRNAAKRVAADSWSLESSTMYEPGEGSVAESTHAYALDIAEGRIRDAALLFDHRQAALVHDLSRRRELIRAIEEASGDAFAFADVPAIANEYLDPTKDRQAFRRYFLNQRVRGAARWIAPEVVEAIVAPRKRRPNAGAKIVAAFDGSYNRDSTALVGCTLGEHPHVFVAGAWEKPRSAAAGSWRTPRGQVMDAVDELMSRYDVLELAPDPHGWHREVEEWEDAYGETVVVFDTSQPTRMGPASSTFLEDAKEQAFTLEASPELARHLGNCIAVSRHGYNVPTKAAATSPDKIDVAIAAVVAYARARHHHLHPPAPRLTWKVV